MPSPLFALLAGRALPQARQLVRVARFADVARELRDGFDELEGKAARIEALEQRVTELERRAEERAKS